MDVILNHSHYYLIANKQQSQLTDDSDANGKGSCDFSSIKIMASEKMHLL